MPNMGIIILSPLQPNKKNTIDLRRKYQIKKYSNFIEEPYYRKSKHKKHSNENSSSKKKDKKYIKCFKCGKKGHIAPNCKVKEIIADLDIGKCLKKQMINIINTEFDSFS